MWYYLKKEEMFDCPAPVHTLDPRMLIRMNSSSYEEERLALKAYEETQKETARVQKEIRQATLRLTMFAACETVKKGDHYVIQLIRRKEWALVDTILDQDEELMFHKPWDKGLFFVTDYSVIQLALILGAPIPTLERLCDHSSNGLNGGIESEPPLYIAIRLENWDALEFLLKRFPELKETVVVWLTVYGTKEGMERFKPVVLEVNCANRNRDCSMLYIALNSANAETSKALVEWDVESGAGKIPYKVGPITLFHETYIELAERKGLKEAAKLLTAQVEKTRKKMKDTVEEKHVCQSGCE